MEENHKGKVWEEEGGWSLGVVRDSYGVGFRSRLGSSWIFLTQRFPLWWVIGVG